MNVVENWTRFNLNAAVENWRGELTPEPKFSPDDRYELETRLREAFADLQAKGLNDEESFWLARRRIGQPSQLREEALKADAVKVWRERILWIAVGILGLRLWSNIAWNSWFTLSKSLETYLTRHGPLLPAWLLDYLPFLRIDSASLIRSPILSILVCYAPVVCLAILFARGRLNWVVARLRFLFKSRRQFLFTATGGLAAYTIYIGLMLRFNAQTFQGNFPISFVVEYAFAAAIWPGALIGLITWLLPTQSPKTPERA